MRSRLVVFGAMALGAGAMLAACSSSPDAANTSSTTTTAATTTTSSTPATTSSTTSTTGSTTSTTGTSSHAVNEAVSTAIRSQLVAAGAALNNIPVAQYSGLTPGLTYYALDKATGTYWAAAQLVPASSSNPNTPPTQAQIASQDDGSYYLFTRPSGKGGTAHADGQTGPDTPCPITVPADVVKLWGWPAGSCRPAST
jgi:hypothetical protein